MVDDQAIPNHGLTANDVVRGVLRLFARHDWLGIAEMPLENGRRVDLAALCPRGLVTIVEIKVSRADLLNDSKWQDYLGHCDRYFWAVPTGFDCSVFERPSLLPLKTGVIVADRYDAAIVRGAVDTPLSAARRKAQTLRLARLAAMRLTIGNDAHATSLA